MTDLLIGIPVFNRREIVQETLTDLYKRNTDEDSYRLMVIDDAPEDGVDKFLNALAASKQNLTHIVNQENHGATAGLNYTMRAATGDYIMMSSDSLIKYDNWIAIMREVSQKFNAVVIPNWGGQPAGSLLEKHDTYHIHEIKTETAFGLVYIPRFAIEKLGAFCSDYGHYWVDVDYSARCHGAGIPLLMVQELEMISVGAPLRPQKERDEIVSKASAIYSRNYAKYKRKEGLKIQL